MECTAPLGSREEKKAFYRWVGQLSAPLIFQGLMSALVSTADVMMLSFVSQEALSASSLASQITFIQEMLIGGVASGATVLSTQYWGKKDTRTVERVLGLAVRISLIIGVTIFLLAACVPGLLMRIYTPDPVLIEQGSLYLRAVSVSYLFSSLVSTYLIVMRSIERVKISAAINSAEVVLNVCLNACFIFGFGPFPKLGIVGVALATSITRALGAAACLVDTSRCRLVRLRIHDLIGRSGTLLRDFFRYALPASVNDISWGLAFSLYSVILGHLSSDIVAANSVTSVVRNLGTVVCYAAGGSCLIVMGKAMGAKQMEKAKVYAKRFILLGVLTAAFGTVVILLCRVPIMRYMELYVTLTDRAREEMWLMLFINAWYIWGTAINTILICGIFRAGGDVRYGMICDTIDMWGYAVPAGLLAAFVFRIPEMWVYGVLCLDEFVKMPFVFHHYHTMKWLRNVTREQPDET